MAGAAFEVELTLDVRFRLNVSNTDFLFFFALFVLVKASSAAQS